MVHKPVWFKVYLWLWITYAVVAAAFCIRMIFNHNNSWRQFSHRNGILWGLFAYLFFRILFYILYLSDDERSLGDFIYFCLIDMPTMIFFLVYTQLVLYWAQMVGSNKLEEQKWKKGYWVLTAVLGIIVIIDIAYRVRDAQDGHEDNLTRYMYGLTIGVLALLLSAGFLYYGSRFYIYLVTLPEGDVRRRRLPRILAAMVLFSAGFLVYGCFIIFGYAAEYDYLPGIDTDLTHGQESALVFRTMDVFLASLILYIVQRPGKASEQFWRTKTFTEPLLDSPGAVETLTEAAQRQGLSLSTSTSEELMLQDAPQSGSSPPPDRRQRAQMAMAQEARRDRFDAMSQPMTMKSSSGGSGIHLTESDDVPYRDRVMKHYRNNYASFASQSPSPVQTAQSYQPPPSTAPAGATVQKDMSGTM